MTALGGVDQKVNWAYQHLENLGSQLRFFEGTNPYEIVPEFDPDDPKKFFQVFRNPKPIRESIVLRSGDVVHNFRSALDHLACVAVESGGGSVTNDTAFPIWRKGTEPTPVEYKALVKGKVNGASQPVVELFEQLEPYFGGIDERLRVLDYLDILDKHRDLIVSFYKGAIVYRMPPKMGGASFVISAKAPDVPFPALKDGDAICDGLVDEDRENNPYIDPTVLIAFGEPWAIQGQAILPTLSELGEYVKGVIDKFRPLL